VLLLLAFSALWMSCDPRDEAAPPEHAEGAEREHNDGAAATERDEGTADDPEAHGDSRADAEADAQYERDRRHAVADSLWRDRYHADTRPEDFVIGPLASRDQLKAAVDESKALFVVRTFLEHLSDGRFAADTVEETAERRLRRSLEPVLEGDLTLSEPWRFGVPQTERDGTVTVPVRYGARLDGALFLTRNDDTWRVSGFDFEITVIEEPRRARRFEPGRGAVPGGL